MCPLPRYSALSPPLQRPVDTYASRPGRPIARQLPTGLLVVRCSSRAALQAVAGPARKARGAQGRGHWPAKRTLSVRHGSSPVEIAIPKGACQAAMLDLVAWKLHGPCVRCWLSAPVRAASSAATSWRKQTHVSEFLWSWARTRRNSKPSFWTVLPSFPGPWRLDTRGRVQPEDAGLSVEHVAVGANVFPTEQVFPLAGYLQASCPWSPDPWSQAPLLSRWLPRFGTSILSHWSLARHGAA